MPAGAVGVGCTGPTVLPYPDPPTGLRIFLKPWPDGAGPGLNGTDEDALGGRCEEGWDGVLQTSLEALGPESTFTNDDGCSGICCET